MRALAVAVVLPHSLRRGHASAEQGTEIGEG